MITFGSDPELIVYQNDVPISMVGLVKGTKKKPEDIPVPGCAQMKDNVLVEFITPPSEDFSDILQSIYDCRKYFNEYLANLGFENCEARFKSSDIYPEIELGTKEAKKFGCDPFLSIYRRGKQTIDGGLMGNRRSAGFHIHFGVNEELRNKESIKKLVFLADMTLGIPSLKYDKDLERSKLYGQLGAYRIKPYGFEYRTLGSGLLNFPNELTRMIKDFTEGMEHLDQVFKGFNEVKEIHSDVFDFSTLKLNQLYKTVFSIPELV